jgi:DNA-binding NarL/FixJ family response regulator
MVAEALAMLLTDRSEFASVTSVGSAEEAIESAGERCPDVVLMDVDLPGIDGIEAAPQLRDICPQTQVVVMTALETADILDRIVGAGATGFVPKAQAVDRLIEVLVRAGEGELVLPAGDMPALLRRLEGVRGHAGDQDVRIARLTERETEVLQTCAEGKTTRETAEALFIAPETVQSHVKSILMKLEVRSKLEAVLYGLRHGAIRLDGSGS